MKTTIKTALLSANSAYLARTEESKRNLSKAGIQKDLDNALSIVEGMTDAQFNEIKKLGIDSQIIAGIKGSTNTKKPMRTLQALLFTITGDGKNLKGSAKTFILEFCGLVIAGAKTRSALAYCATGAGNESTSDEVKVTKAKQVIRAFGQIGVSTESTQNSVSFSKGGIAETLGVAVKDKRNGMPVVDLSNKVAQKLDEIIKGMTDNKLALLVAQSSERSK